MDVNVEVYRGRDEKSTEEDLKRRNGILMRFGGKHGRNEMRRRRGTNIEIFGISLEERSRKSHRFL